MAPPIGSLSPVAPGGKPTLPGTFTSRASLTIERYQLLEPGCRVLAAVSGGRDSTALALLLDALGYELVVGHVDHAMRTGSEDDAVHCEALAARLGIAFCTVRLDRPPASEAAARRARYQALEDMALQSNASCIATGHTLDDAAETVVMRLGRGGAAVGIPPRRDRIVRPLIELRRADTEAVCRVAGAAWIDDASNEDERHRRNRLRKRAMPALEEATSRLAAVGTANAVQAQRRRLEAEALAATVVRQGGSPDEQRRELARPLPGGSPDEQRRELARPLPGGSPNGTRCEIDRQALAGLPRPAAMDLVRFCMERLGIAASERAVRDVVDKVATATGAGLDLPGGKRAWSDAGRLVIGSAPNAPVLPQVALATGTTVSPEWGLTVLVEEVDPATRPSGPLEAVVDASAGSAGLVMRQRRPGDRFVPLGGPGHVSLQDLFVDLKVPREDRAQVPVIVAGDEVVWLPGFRIGQRWKVEPHSPGALRIRLLGPVRTVAI